MRKYALILTSFMFLLGSAATAVESSTARKAAGNGRAAGPLLIYDDQLRNDFVDWSWGTVSFNQTAVVHSGTAAISFEPDGWAGLFLHRDAGISLVAYEALEFWVNGGGTGGQVLRIAILMGDSIAGSAPLAPFVDGGAIPAGQWAKARVPVADLGVTSGVLSGFWLQDDTGGNQPAVYLDDLSAAERTGPPPPPVPVAVAVNTHADVRPVNPLIYGVNFGDSAQFQVMGYPLRRWGGNSTTRYNWQNDTSNRAMDWFFLNIPEDNPDPGSLPDNSATDRFIDETLDAGAEVLLTVPIIGWTPVDRTRRWGFSVAKYGSQAQTECTASGYAEWCNPDAGNGVHSDGSPITGNDPLDTSSPIGPGFVTQWMAHIAGRVGTAAAGGVRLFALDNEPVLWNSTHRDVHPEPLTYDELWQRTRDYAAAIKGQDPGARVLGPVSWGWCDYFGSAADSCMDGPDRQAHGGMPLVEWYLKQVHDYEQTTGTRLVDYLDIHYYPQGGNVAFGGEDQAALRLRSLKGLYDPDYVDESWIGQPVRLIPRMREWIDSRAPGTRLAITEYCWGDDDCPSGALAQAEVLAIFGREGVDLATRWVAPAVNSVTEDAFKLFLNYDGQGGRVEGDSIRAVSGDVDAVGAYAVRGSLDRLFLLLFNKDLAAREAGISITGGITRPAALYRFDAASRLSPAGEAAPAGEGFQIELPPRSATLAVVNLIRVHGDLDGDGLVQAQDRAILAGCLAGTYSAGTTPFTALPGQADLNRDGRITVADLVILTGYLAGKIPSLPWTD